MKKGTDGVYYRYIKRLLDIFCAIAAMIVFCWLYVIIAILVRIKVGTPVIFKQPRPGKDERIFTLYKFRTMTDERDEEGKYLPDSVRLTKFGRILRSTSLDELPEAWNILKGDMSVVGPRPLLVQYLPLYDNCQRRRHEVRPGLSGFAQISGRNALSWEEKFKFDICYVNSVNFSLDIKIIFLTIKAMLRRDGICGNNLDTAEEFVGSKEKANV